MKFSLNESPVKNVSQNEIPDTSGCQSRMKSSLDFIHNEIPDSPGIRSDKILPDVSLVKNSIQISPGVQAKKSRWNSDSPK